MEKKLLELTFEYSAAKDTTELDPAFPGMPVRALDDIAAEYGQVLKEFLTGDTGIMPGGSVGMGSASVGDLAESIRAQAETIINATAEAEITDALEDIEAAVARIRAIL